jgi:hypothetical protein
MGYDARQTRVFAVHNDSPRTAKAHKYPPLQAAAQQLQPTHFPQPLRTVDLVIGWSSFDENFLYNPATSPKPYPPTPPLPADPPPHSLPRAANHLAPSPHLPSFSRSGGSGGGGLEAAAASTAAGPEAQLGLSTTVRPAPRRGEHNPLNHGLPRARRGATGSEAAWPAPNNDAAGPEAAWTAPNSGAAGSFVARPAHKGGMGGPHWWRGWPQRAATASSAGQFICA